MAHQKNRARANLMFNAMRFSYGCSVEYLRRTFQIPIEKSVKAWFGYGLQKLTLYDFEVCCDIMVNHKPHEVLEMLLSRRLSKGFLKQMVKDLKAYDKLINNDSERQRIIEGRNTVFLNKILNAKTFEERQSAIVEAENYKRKIEFKI